MSRYLWIVGLLCAALALPRANARVSVAKAELPTLRHAVFRCVLPTGTILYTNEPSIGCQIIFLYDERALRPDHNGARAKARTDHAELTGAASPAVRVFRLAAPSVVQILTYTSTGDPVAQGSGVVVPHDLVATNCHVLSGGTVFLVRSGIRGYVAGLKAGDPNRDVCLLDVPGLPLPPVRFGTTKELQVGENVFAIGSPEGFGGTLSEGIVSSLRPTGDGSYIQTTAAISPGSSGGGLFDSRGRLLGLTSYYARDGEQLNFALPAEWIEQLMPASSSASERGHRAIR